jgi:hypothetical protein
MGIKERQHRATGLAEKGGGKGISLTNCTHIGYNCIQIGCACLEVLIATAEQSTSERCSPRRESGDR